ncbi:hypothetical protein [Thalassobius sp. I31.1]|uniref:hypothetical protein n=1 Tax=Thalassobius sp. I31.1 TaxID=2109912 RepID=UPI000D1AEC97|nr:hypothetical protein [Thalassobius sp. I31.1]
MKHLTEKAEQALISTCIFIAVSSRDEDARALMIENLRDILNDCAKGSEAVLDLRVAAQAVVLATQGRARMVALEGLKKTVEEYTMVAASQRFRGYLRARGH